MPLWIEDFPHVGCAGFSDAALASASDRQGYFRSHKVAVMLRRWIHCLTHWAAGDGADFEEDLIRYLHKYYVGPSMFWIL